MAQLTLTLKLSFTTTRVNNLAYLSIQYTSPNTTIPQPKTTTNVYEHSQTDKLYLTRKVFSTMALDILYGMSRKYFAKTSTRDKNHIS